MQRITGEKNSQESDKVVFDHAVMTRKKVRAYNKTAHKVGRHLCPTCLIEYDWTNENFHKYGKRPKKDGSFSLSNDCSTCRSKHYSRLSVKKYHEDREYKQAIKDRNKRSWANMTPYGRKRKRKLSRDSAARMRKHFDINAVWSTDFKSMKCIDVKRANHDLVDSRLRVCLHCRVVKPITSYRRNKYGHISYTCNECKLIERANSKQDSPSRICRSVRDDRTEQH